VIQTVWIVDIINLTRNCMLNRTLKTQQWLMSSNLVVWRKTEVLFTIVWH